MSRSRMAYAVAMFPVVSESFVIREVQALENRGFDVWVYAIKRPPPASEEKALCGPDLRARVRYARPDGLLRHLAGNALALAFHPVRYVRTLRVFLAQALRTKPPSFLRALAHFFYGIGFSRDLKKRKVDQIHAHFTAAADVALAASLFLGIRFSFTAHASGDIFVEPVLLDEKLRKASHVVAVCDYSRKYLDSITGYAHSDKIVRVYNGIRTSEPRDLLGEGAAAARPSDGMVRLMSMGRLVEAKGFRCLLAGCAVLKREGRDFTCRIVGDGPLRADLERLIERWDLRGRVRVDGYGSLRDAYRALRDSDVFVLLSEIHVGGYRDGFPTVILEAMVAGLPVVSTWISGIPEMVVHGETGLLVHERDPEAAAAAISRLIADPGLRERFGAAGRRRAECLFDLDRTIAAAAELFAAARKKGDGPTAVRSLFE